MPIVEILGPGCANCRKLEAVTREAAAAAGVQADIRKVKDIVDIVSYGLTATPGLVIDGKLVCSGRIPAIAEVQAWLGA